MNAVLWGLAAVLIGLAVAVFVSGVIAAWNRYQ